MRGEWVVKLDIHGVIQDEFAIDCKFAVGIAFATFAVVSYYTAKLTILNNLLGMGLCYGLFMSVTGTSFGICSLVLIGLVIYDVVMVFFT